MNTAIIVAAGSGTRFAKAQLKQFVPVLGKPLIIHTLQRFEASPAIDNIILVLSADGLETFKGMREQFPVSKLTAIVIGGSTRAESVNNGLSAVEAAPDDIIAVHDGARPLVEVDEITRTVQKAMASAAACLVAAVTDTIKGVEGDAIVRTVDRGTLRRALTPQAFRYDLLRRAFDSSELGDDVTDECFLVEKLGVPVAMVAGSVWNIKVTHPEDIFVAEALLSRRDQ
jgi:2-C-methyl-D-erythritol 4-phosphate cytidylyltransferase